MKITVTGATGFIGRALVERLIAAKHQVTSLARRPSVAAPTGLRVEHFDAHEPAREGLLRGAEVVIHLAGAPIAERWTDAHKAAILSSRVEGTRAIAKAAAESGTVHTLISASAIGYYGAHGDEPLDESARPGSDFLAEVCVAWEAATAAAVKAGIRVVIPRFGVVLHPEGGALEKMLKPFRIGAGGPMGTGDQVMSWIHREDLLSMLLFLMEHRELAGHFNATAPYPATSRELAHAIGEVLHRPSLIPTPAFALKLALGEMSSMLLTGQRVLPKRALQAGFGFRFPHLREALVDLLR